MKLATTLNSLESFLVTLGDWLQAPLLLVLRLYWGWSFVQTGWDKLTHLARTAGYFESLHIPAPQLNALLAGGTECLGGALLLLGLYARFATPALVFTTVVAYATAEREALTAIVSDRRQVHRRDAVSLSAGRADRVRARPRQALARRVAAEKGLGGRLTLSQPWCRR